jgi:hypothetical protein
VRERERERNCECGCACACVCEVDWPMEKERDQRHRKFAKGIERLWEGEREKKWTDRERKRMCE